MKYSPASTAPAATKEFQLWLLDELRNVSDSISEMTVDTLLLKEWNAEPAKLYDGLIAFADGSNWNPGSGQGFYGYYASAWHFLG